MQAGRENSAILRTQYSCWPRIWLAGIVVILVSTFVLAGQKTSEQTSALHFLIVRQEDGKPVRNASVVLHPLGRDGRQGSNGYQLKTDSAGEASIDGISYGRLRVQVIAPHFQTYGEDYDVSQPKIEFRIELKPPKAQVSIY